MSDHRDRYREIAEALSRHGLGYLIGVLGLERRVPFHRGLLGHAPREDAYTQPEHVRLALEQLGATFVKLGQILSTRADLLGPAYQVEMTKLQDAAPQVSSEAVREVITQELGQDPSTAFASFDDVPLAAASIGQAHAATLHDGTEVVVKVRRPEVVEQIEEDLEILRNLAAHAARHWEPASEYDIVGLVDEFAGTLQAEVDYLREARNAERFAVNFARDDEVHIPRVFWDTTTSRVLTLERLRGIKIDDTDALDEAAIDRRALAELATRVIAQMVFEDGLFHADPHPGNFFVEPGGRLGIIDFGMVGEIDERLRGQLAALLVAIARGDARQVTDAVLGLSVHRGSVDTPTLRTDLEALIARHRALAVGEIELAAVVGEALAIVRRHRLQLPHELALLLKMVAMTEGMAAALDPEFNLADVLGPYARRLVAHQLSPAALARRVGEASLEIAQLAEELPDQIRRFLSVLESGGLDVHLRAGEISALAARTERVGNRIVAATIAAALIEALADSGRKRAWERPMLGGAVGALAGYLVWSGRKRREDAG